MGKLLWWRSRNGDCLSIYSFLGIFCLFFSPTQWKAAIARSTVQWSRVEWNSARAWRGRWIMVQYDTHPSLQWIRLYLFWVVQCLQLKGLKWGKLARLLDLIPYSPVECKPLISGLVCNLSRSYQVLLSCISQSYKKEKKTQQDLIETIIYILSS